ncbi:MAG: hypothetical protein ACLP9L_29580 [Thermoguttaceae bacterium]
MKNVIGRRGVAALVLVATLVLLLWQAPPAEFYLNSQDHGLQLCGGQQVLQGKIPCHDLFTPYGPLVFYSSALGIALSGSLVGETILCSLGYALALWIVYLMVSRHASRLAGLLALAATYLTLARFYKWYFWLFPLAVLLALDGYRAASGGRRRAWAFAAGILVGLQWLIRFDIGTTGFVAATIFIIVVEGAWSVHSIRRCAAPLAILLASAAVPLGAWFGLLLSVGRLGACREFMAMLTDGTHCTLTVYSHPPSSFEWTHPLSAASLLYAAYGFAALTYVCCGFSALEAEIRGKPSRRSRALLATTLIGLSVFHQALHRCDGPHLLQVMPPAIIAAAMLLDGWFRAAKELLAEQRIAFVGGLAYLSLALAAGAAMFPFGRIDLASPTLCLGARMAELARPIESIRNVATRDAFEEIQRRTGTDESILVYPAPCQYYFFAGRRMSGLYLGYLRGEMAGAGWEERNCEALNKDMPKVVMVMSKLLAMPPVVNGLPFAYGSDRIEAILRDPRWTKVFDREGIILLERSERPQPERVAQKR